MQGVTVVLSDGFSQQELLDILRAVTVFSGFSDTELQQVCGSCSVMQARIGEVLFEQGTPATEIFILLKGKVTIILNLTEEPLELVELGPGSCIGEASVIGIQDHSASVVALTDSTLIVLSRKVIMQILEQDKGLFSLLILNIARELARRLHYTDEVLFQYSRIAAKNLKKAIPGLGPIDVKH